MGVDQANGDMAVCCIGRRRYVSALEGGIDWEIRRVLDSRQIPF